MVFVLNEKQARHIFCRYKNVAAFAFGDQKGIFEDTLEISYAKLDFMPDNDTINAVISGDLKKAKLFRSAVNALHQPANKSNQRICVGMTQLVNMIDPDSKEKATKPNIIVFVKEPEDAKNSSEKNIILTKWVSKLFGEFGIKVLDGDSKKTKKVLKKLFKGKALSEYNSEKSVRKAKWKRYKKVATYLSEHKKYRISKEGSRLKKILITYFAIELSQMAIGNIGLENLSNKDRNAVITELINAYTNENLRVICTLNLKNKKEKKLCKNLVKKNGRVAEAYVVLSGMLRAVDPSIELPEIKHGTKKKKGKKVPKMNTKKFIKFYRKGKNIYYLGMIYAHTAATTLGADVGSRDYNHYMAAVTSLISKDFASKFTSVAKQWKEA